MFVDDVGEVEKQPREISTFQTREWMEIERVCEREGEGEGEGTGKTDIEYESLRMLQLKWDGEQWTTVT